MIKKIAYLFSPGPFGGAEQIVLKSVQALQIQHLWLIEESRNPSPCQEFAKRCHENGIAFTLIGCDYQFDSQTLKKLKKLIKQFEVDIVHSHGMKANFFNALLPVKKIATQHGKTSHSLKTRLLETIEAIALKRMNKLICVSRQMYELEKHPHKVLVENFLSMTFQTKIYQVNKILKLVYIGRLSKEKGLLDLWQALKKLQHIELTIVGEGQLLQQLQASRIESNTVRFVGFQKTIGGFLQEADALILPSHREGLPMIIIEAAAAGVPILASHVGGIPDVVGEAAILFKPEQPTEIVKSIELFNKSREIYNEKAKQLAPKIQERYGLTSWIKCMINLYQSLE
jgi:glycosyltransferase involved in cell wall biosynthesis